jgi:hypothetical protein
VPVFRKLLSNPPANHSPQLAVESFNSREFRHVFLDRCDDFFLKTEWSGNGLLQWEGLDALPPQEEDLRLHLQRRCGELFATNRYHISALLLITVDDGLEIFAVPSWNGPR